VRWTNDQTAS